MVNTSATEDPCAHPAHSHSVLGTLFEHRKVPLRNLYFSIGITLAGMVVEIAGGLFTGSLALISDAGHMFTHVFALGISAFAIRLASQPRCHHRTFGLLRAEVLAAYTNAIFLFGVTAYIAYEGVVRMLNPVEILASEMLVVATVGLVVNIISIFLLHGHEKNISVRSAVAHMMADALSSVAIMVGAFVMAGTGWRWIDPLLSIGIAGVILVWAWGLFRDSVRILMEVAPAHINTHDVESFVAAEFPNIASLNRVRIWSITEDVVAFSAEVIVEEKESSQHAAAAVIDELAAGLKAHFHFEETTLELRLRE